jgi:hypothetical protein
MIVEMIVGKIREDGDIELNTTHPRLMKRVRRHLHHPSGILSINGLAQCFMER